jgi:hypothetical protein
MELQKRFRGLLAPDEFKSLAGIDGREDDFARFLLETATCQIERYCMRRLLYQKITQEFDFTGGTTLSCWSIRYARF